MNSDFIKQLRENPLRTRTDTVKLLLDMIRPLKPYYSPGHAWLHLGDTGAHYGRKAAGMEGFARVLWGLGPLFAGENQGLSEVLSEELEEWHRFYLAGIIHGTDPEHEEYWGNLTDYDQKMVEMASLAIAVCLSPEKMWEPLKPKERASFYQWMNQINHRAVHENNWRFFRILVNMMFRLLGLTYSQERLKEDFQVIESCYIKDGWYYDGNPGQMDYYIPFAMHFYGLIYAFFMENKEPEYTRNLKQRGKQFFADYKYWFSQDGTEIPFGRSLTYRFAHGAYFSAMALACPDEIPMGEAKTLLLGNLRRWMEKPIFDNGGALSIGYGYPNLIMSERYNAPGSPYWAFKTFLVLALPDCHPFWEAEEQAIEYQEKKLLEQPHMLITHSEGDHVQAYVTAQHCMNHGNSSAKYEKFVYSNRYGFSVSRGYGLSDGALDNTLSVCQEGENYYQVRYGAAEYRITEDYVSSSYRIGRSTEVTSTIIPCGSWHVRIHRIWTQVKLIAADAGYAISAEPGFYMTSGETDGRYAPDMLEVKDSLAFARFPWGSSGVNGLTGGTGEIITTFPNTNLLANLAVMPVVSIHLEPGEHLYVNCFYGNPLGPWEYQLETMPEIVIEGSQVSVIPEKGRVIQIDSRIRSGIDLDR